MICELLVNKVYDKHIKIPERQKLHTIIDGFEEMTNIPYIWTTIYGFHIVLSKKSTIQQVPNDNL